MYTQFCEKYRQCAQITKAPMRILHKPGDAAQMDWADNKLNIFITWLLWTAARHIWEQSPKRLLTAGTVAKPMLGRGGSSSTSWFSDRDTAAKAP